MTPSSSPVLAACLCILLSAMAAQAAGSSVAPKTRSPWVSNPAVSAAARGAEKPGLIDVSHKHRRAYERGVYLTPGENSAGTVASVERMMPDESLIQLRLPANVDMVSARPAGRCVAPKIVQVATVRPVRHLPKVIYGSASPCEVRLARVSAKRSRETWLR